MSLIRYFCNYTSNGMKTFTIYLFICWFTEWSEKGIGVVTWIDLPFDCPSDLFFRQKSYCLNTKVKYWKSVGVLFSPYSLMKIILWELLKENQNRMESRTVWPFSLPVAQTQNQLEIRWKILSCDRTLLHVNVFPAFVKKKPNKIQKLLNSLVHLQWNFRVTWNLFIITRLQYNKIWNILKRSDGDNYNQFHFKWTGLYFYYHQWSKIEACGIYTSVMAINNH